MPWLELFGIGISVTAGIIAIRGETWNAKAERWHRKLTLTGWASLVVIIVGGGVSSYAAWREHWLDRLAVYPILSRLELLYDFTAQYRVLQDVAASDDKKRAIQANELLKSPETVDQYRRNCRDYTETWVRWKGETDPRVRSDLQMIAFMCRREKAAPGPIMQDALKVARYSVCRIYSQSSLCQPKKEKLVRERLNQTYFAPRMNGDNGG